MTSNSDSPRDGLPPFVKTWPQMYAFVVGFLVLVIVLLYLLMRYFQ